LFLKENTETISENNALKKTYKFIETKILHRGFVAANRWRSSQLDRYRSNIDSIS